MADDFTSSSFYGEDNQDLRGPKGDQGDAGPQGPLGPKGETGDVGSPGKDSQYRYGSFAVMGIQASEIIMDHDVIEAHTLGSDFVGSVASCSTPPEADWIATIARNGIGIGTLRITPASTIILATTGHVAVAIAARDVITVIAPSDPDPSIGRVRFTFAGSL